MHSNIFHLFKRPRHVSLQSTKHLSIQQSFYLLNQEMKMALMNFFFATFMLLLSLSASALASDGEYNPHSNLQKQNLEKEKLLSTMIGIQGLVYCRSGSKLAPLEGNSPPPQILLQS